MSSDISYNISDISTAYTTVGIVVGPWAHYYSLVPRYEGIPTRLSANSRQAISLLSPAFGRELYICSIYTPMVLCPQPVQ